MGTPNSRSTNPGLFMARSLTKIGNISFLLYDQRRIKRPRVTEFPLTRYIFDPPRLRFSRPHALRMRSRVSSDSVRNQKRTGCFISNRLRYIHKSTPKNFVAMELLRTPIREVPFCP